MSVTISQERYEELVRAETERDVLVGIAENERADYRMSEMARIVLKPYMRPEPTEGCEKCAE